MTLAERIEVRKAAVRAEMEARVAERLGPASAASATTSSDAKLSHASHAGGSIIAPEGAVVGVAPLGADAVHLDFDEPSQDRADADAGEASGVEERPEEATQGSSVLSDDHDEDDLPLPLPEEEEDDSRGTTKRLVDKHQDRITEIAENARIAYHQARIQKKRKQTLNCMYSFLSSAAFLVFSVI
jgi:hypothetical protein